MSFELPDKRTFGAGTVVSADSLNKIVDSVQANKDDATTNAAAVHTTKVSLANRRAGYKSSLATKVSTLPGDFPLFKKTTLAETGRFRGNTNKSFGTNYSSTAEFLASPYISRSDYGFSSPTSSDLTISRRAFSSFVNIFKWGLLFEGLVYSSSLESVLSRACVFFPSGPTLDGFRDRKVYLFSHGYIALDYYSLTTGVSSGAQIWDKITIDVSKSSSSGR